MLRHPARLLSGRFHPTRTLAILLFIATLPACSNPFDFAHCPQIMGRVTHHGLPVAGSLVVYTPEAFEAGSSWGVASTDGDGFYRMTSTERGDPLITGWYRITVVMGQGRGPKSSEGLSKSNPIGLKSRHGQDEEDSTTDQPAKADEEDRKVDNALKVYEDPKTSPLKLWVRAQSMTIDINLPN